MAELTPMEQFTADVTALVTSYGVSANGLDVSLAIELFQDARNYPSSYTEIKIIADMQKNINKIAMAVIELDAKVGVEGQTGHSENGTNRTYGNAIVAYKYVVPFAKVVY